MALRGIYYLLLFSIINTNSLFAQENNFYSTSNISSMLDKLDVFGKVLYIAAHPDDENTRLIAYLANEKKYETAYLSERLRPHLRQRVQPLFRYLHRLRQRGRMRLEYH